MEKFVIDGGVPLRGTVVPAGNKNAALPILAASRADRRGGRRAQRAAHPRRRGDAARARRHRRARRLARRQRGRAVRRRRRRRAPHVDREHAERIRASFLLAGPLLARFGRAEMPPPGGDVIGRRRLDPHLDAFRALGRDASSTTRDIVHRRAARRAARRRRLHGRAVGHGDRERADGRRADARRRPSSATPPASRTSRTSRGCSSKMGADIRGIGSNVLTVTGRRRARRLHARRSAPTTSRSARSWRSPGVTGGELRIEDTEPDDLRMIRLVFGSLGLHTELDGADVIVPGGQKLIAARDVGEYKAKVQDGPWPAFPADLTSIAVALATQCEGSVLIHEWMFENRLIFTDKLVADGRRHHASATRTARSSAARRRLRGERVESPDIRAGHGDADRRAVRRRPQRDRQHPPDRPRLRAHRRAPARARRADRARRHRARRARACSA